MVALKPTPETTVLDVGGLPWNWKGINARVMLVNLDLYRDYVPEPGERPIPAQFGDGCDAKSGFRRRRGPSL